MDRKGHLAGAGLISISDAQPVLVLQRVAVLASGENRALPSGSASETNNECQIKCKLLQHRLFFPLLGLVPDRDETRAPPPAHCENQQPLSD